jgi:hypothetical protein
MGLSERYDVLDDEACQDVVRYHGKRRTLPLYTKLVAAADVTQTGDDGEYDPETRAQNLTRVDIIVRRWGDRTVPIIIEIEETNDIPNHLYGKFLSSATSDFYYDLVERQALADDLLFIQIVKPQRGNPLAPPMRRKWRIVEERIRAIPSPKQGRTCTYYLFYEAGGELVSESGADFYGVIDGHLLGGGDSVQE